MHCSAIPAPLSASFYEAPLQPPAPAGLPARLARLLSSGIGRQGDCGDIPGADCRLPDHLFAQPKINAGPDRRRVEIVTSLIWSSHRYFSCFRAYIVHGVGGYDPSLVPSSDKLNFFAGTLSDYAADSGLSGIVRGNLLSSFSHLTAESGIASRASSLLCSPLPLSTGAYSRSSVTTDSRRSDGNDDGGGRRCSFFPDRHPGLPITCPFCQRRDQTSLPGPRTCLSERCHDESS